MEIRETAGRVFIDNKRSSHQELSPNTLTILSSEDSNYKCDVRPQKSLTLHLTESENLASDLSFGVEEVVVHILGPVCGDSWTFEKKLHVRLALMFDSHF